MLTTKALIFITLFSGLAHANPLWYAWWVHFDEIRWSPDGKRIAFEANRVGTGAGKYWIDILQLNLENKRLTCLTPRLDAVQLSSSRSHLLFKDFYGIYLLRLEKTGRPIGKPIQLNPAPLLYLRMFGFSSDGQKVYYGRYDFDTDAIKAYYQVMIPEILKGEEIIIKTISELPVEVYQRYHYRSSQRKERQEWNLGPFEIPPSRQVGDVVYHNKIEGTKRTIFQGYYVLNWLPSPDNKRIVAYIKRPDDKRRVGGAFWLLDSSDGSAHLLANHNIRHFNWITSQHAIWSQSNSPGKLWHGDLSALEISEFDLSSVPDWSPKRKEPKYTIQIKATASLDIANAFADSLAGLGVNLWLEYYYDQKNGQNTYRIRFGKFETIPQAKEAFTSLDRKYGLPGWLDEIDYFSRRPTQEICCQVRSPDGKKVAYLKLYQNQGYFASSVWISDINRGTDEQVLTKFANF